MAAIKPKKLEFNDQFFAHEINLLLACKPVDMKQIKDWLGFSTSKVYEMINWEAMKSADRRKIQSTFMLQNCSTAEFDEWIENLKANDSSQRRRAQQQEETEANAALHDENMRYPRASFERMEYKFVEH